MAIKIDKLSVTIKDELQWHSEQVVKAVNAESKKAVKQLKQETYDAAPKDTGAYRDAIATKKVDTDTFGNETYMWYVKSPEHALSHLINNDYVQRDGNIHKGSRFIDKAVEKVSEEYVKNVEEAIKNA